MAVQKYCDALPLYRQTAIFKRLGIELDRTNLSHWMLKAGALVQPLINLLLEQVMAQPVVHLDETTVQVLKEPGKTAESNSYMWLMASFEAQPAIVFHYATTRSQRVPLAQLSHGVQAIMVDGYEGYQRACNAIRPFTIGRKNWLFSNSQAGATASANLYGLIEAAKANDLNPYDYFKQIFEALPNAESVEDVENLLPCHGRLN